MRVCDIPEIDNLTTPEKILLVEDIWDSICLDESSIPIPQSHIEELDNRLKRYKSDPGNLLSLDELKSRIEKKEMNYSLHFVPEIENDTFSGYLWYEEKASGLGEEFLRIFYANAYELQRNPLLYQKVYLEFRRRLLKRFPYTIYYMIENDMIIVFGVFHCARDPRSIKKILSDRSYPEEK